MTPTSQKQTLEFSLNDDQFLHAINFVLEQEGGYSNHDTDRGGETIYGLSRKQYPHEDFTAITKQRVRFLYCQDYYLKTGCQLFSPAISLWLFDSAVQHGPHRAIKLLQQAVDVKDDGLLGPITISAVQYADREWLMSRFLVRRSRFYAQIIANDISQALFYKGWFNRLSDVLDEAWTSN